ncbi:unnamed protein product, partial [Allacma fusca]
ANLTIKYEKDKNIGRKGSVIVILGWTGSQHKYLEKYAEFYLQRGFIVLRCITPVRVIAHNQCMFPLVAKAVLSALKKYNLNSHPLFLHVFSNGGSYLYSYLLKEISVGKNQLKLDVRGTIFDSGPYPRSVKTQYRAVAAIFDSTKILKPIIGGLFALYFIISMLWNYISLGWKVCMDGEAVKRSDTFDEVTKPFPLYGWLTRITKLKNHNFIFLYSKKDYIAPWQQVEAVANELERRGNFVVRKEFQGSDHVSHYRMHPKEYMTAIDNFICSSMGKVPVKPINHLKYSNLRLLVLSELKSFNYCLETGWTASYHTWNFKIQIV